MLNIIIVEDNRDLRETLLDVMAAEGHHAAAFESAEALWSGCSFQTTDIIVLDLNLPGEDGISVARRVRAEHPGIGIVMLTARGEPDERRVGYENGADIYLVKPSSVPELISSIQALARRLNQGKAEPDVLVVDPIAMTLSGPADMVPLSPSEVELLSAFARAPHKRLKTTHIAAMIGHKGEISKSAIEVRIVRLRKKMFAAGAAGQPINVVRNHGYQLSARIDIV
jgi:DNA-binding response OmpR family regulator